MESIDLWRSPSSHGGGFKRFASEQQNMTLYPASLYEASVELSSGKQSPIEYVEKLCNRIIHVESEVRALILEPNRRERLRATVATEQERVSNRATRNPMFGIPVGVKDIIHVDGFTTQAGTALPPELFAGPQAQVVTALQDAGAVILGKTVTTEFAGHAPGLTRNPHDLNHTPGGSSSGSAAAVAAGLCPLAIGTQTGGSVIRPAAFCGVVGFKPSFGRIPTDGIIPCSQSVDQVGLFTQEIPGMRLAASTVCEEWKLDHPVSNPTLGIPEGPLLGKASVEGLNAFENQVDDLTSVGYDIRRQELFKDIETIDEWHRNVIRKETAMVHTQWFDEYKPFYRTTTAEAIRDGRKVTDDELATGRAGRAKIRKRIHRKMDAAGIDIWITPATRGPAPKGLASTGSSAMNRPWTYAGLPALTIPAGTIDGLPIGLQCVTRRYEDEQLLSWVNVLSQKLT